VRSIAEGNRLLVEHRVNFSDWVPEGFGTSDAIVIDEDTETLYIIDLKYGKGVVVGAEDNTQGILYALGAYSELSLVSGFTKVVIIIHQPRLDHVSEWSLSVDDLLKWGEFIKERAELALQPDAPRTPGEKQCQWCKAKATCPALEKLTRDVIASDFDDMTSPDKLNDQQLRLALDNKKLINSWFDAVESLITERLQAGDGFEGYKLVEGRSLRDWADVEQAEVFLVESLGDKAHEKKLLSVAKAEKLFKKDQREQLNAMIKKPKGKPTLAPESDPRPAINFDIDDFDALQDD
jgi:hypothetical protein